MKNIKYSAMVIMQDRIKDFLLEDLYEEQGKYKEMKETLELLNKELKKEKYFGCNYIDV